MKGCQLEESSEIETTVGEECTEKQRRVGTRVKLKGPVSESWRDVFSDEAPRKRQELKERKRCERQRTHSNKGTLQGSQSSQWSLLKFLIL